MIVTLGAPATSGGQIRLADSPKGPPTTVTQQQQPPGVQPHDGATCDLNGPDPILAPRIAAVGDSIAAWNSWRIPEYQDAQHFVLQPRDGYGPLACVVARPDVGSITPAQFAAGAVVGVIYLAAKAPDNHAYGDLHLSAAGFYCIVLKGALRSVGLTGYIVPAADKKCGDPSEATKVDAFAYQWPGITDPRDYPAVARFVLRQNRDPGIGIRCGRLWCTLGFKNMAGADGMAHAVPADGPNKVRHTVHGWFDQQYLGLPVAGSSPPRLRAAGIKASIVADALLDRYRITPTVNDFTTRRVVARVYMPAGVSIGKYETNWQFTRRGRDSANVIELQQVGPATWKVFINGTENTKLKVTRADHSGAGIHIAGTARWRWKDGDEAIWVRCGEGCCSVDEI